MSYVPIFSDVLQSSLWYEPKHVRLMFITLLVLKDREHIVHCDSSFSLAKHAQLTEAEAIEALRVLSSPDTRRLEPQPYEGRRIERVEGGWRILNGEKYQRKMSELHRRAYQRAKQAEYRDRRKQRQAKGGLTLEEQNAIKAYENQEQP